AARILRSGNTESRDGVLENLVPAHHVIQRGIVRPARESESLVVLDETIPEKRLRRVPIPHRGIVANESWRIGRGVEYDTLDDIGKRGRRLVVLSRRGRRVCQDK